MSKKLIFLLPLVIFFLVLPLKTQAFTTRAGDSVYIPKDQVIDGNFYAAGSNLTVDGDVQGDVICAGQNVTISGKVDGDVICAAQTLTINGVVGGNVRSTGNTVTVNGSVGRNINVAAMSFILGNDANVGWDVLVGAALTEIRGTINGGLQGAINNLIVSGHVVKNIDIHIDSYANKNNGGQLKITDQAKIDGDVNYWANKNGDINQNNVSGKITHNIPTARANGLFLTFILNRLYAIFSALLVGLVLVSVWRKHILALTKRMEVNLAAAIGWGAVLLFITPIICILLLLTLIGIPLAIILAGLWILAMFICKIVTAVLAGRFIFRKLKQKETEKLLLEMTVGVIVCWLLFAIPILGWALSLVAIWWGFGGAWLYFRHQKA